jgi:hypothetical protein
MQSIKNPRKRNSIDGQAVSSAGEEENSSVRTRLGRGVSLEKIRERAEMT